MARGCQRLWLRWNEARTIAAVNETKRASSGWKVGCIVTAIVLGVLGFCCGGTLLGTTFWASRNPTLRRGFAIVGGAIELAREGQNQPGAAQMRSAGCVSAFVLTPELLRRFVALLPDAGPGGGGVPQYPMIVCGARRDSVLTCEQVARVYGSAIADPPAEIAVQVTVQNENGPRCQGMYGPDGTYLREVDRQHSGTFDQVGTQQP
jgi:hypothetical protein